MKAHRHILLLFLTMLVLVFPGCNHEEEASAASGRDLFRIQEEEMLLSGPNADEGKELLGMQFYGDEIVQFWGEKKVDEHLHSTWDVYLYRGEGSGEFLFGGIPSQYRDGFCMDGEGGYYVLLGGTIVKLNEKGEEQYQRTYDITFSNLYQDEQGKWRLTGKTRDGLVKDYELNQETGEIAEKQFFSFGEEDVRYVTGQKEGLYAINSQGVWKINALEGSKDCLISFKETQYTFSLTMEKFRVTEDGKVEILQLGKRIILERVNLGETRDIVVLGGYSFGASVRKFVEEFNAQSEDCYVLLEEGKETQEDSELWKNKMGIELANGEGPDLIYVGSSVDNASELRDKGAFEKLNSYMEASGFVESDFFPATFDVMRKGEDIYGATPMMQPTGVWVDKAVLGNVEEITVEKFLDALLAYKEDAILKKSWDGAWIMNRLLVASDSLFGMVDWEKGTCDFDTDLFVKMLQVAKQYGDNGTNTLPEVVGWANGNSLYQYSSQKKLQSENKVAVGYFFDDGCRRGISTGNTLAINSNSPVKEGAWKFIEWMLTGELQSVWTEIFMPVNKEGFAAMIQREIEEGSVRETLGVGGRTDYYYKAGTSEYENQLEAYLDYDNYRANHDITQELADEIYTMMDETRAFPIRTQPLIEIITEEAGGYFADAKTIEEVCKTIENRVQLYLDEHK